MSDLPGIALVLSVVDEDVGCESMESTVSWLSSSTLTAVESAAEVDVAEAAAFLRRSFLRACLRAAAPDDRTGLAFGELAVAAEGTAAGDSVVGGAELVG